MQIAKIIPTFICNRLERISFYNPFYDSMISIEAYLWYYNIFKICSPHVAELGIPQPFTIPVNLLHFFLVHSVHFSLVKHDGRCILFSLGILSAIVLTNF